jgi:hypothetical protein
MLSHPQPERITTQSIVARAILYTLLFLIIGVGGDYVADRLGLEHDLLYLNDVISAVFIGLLIVLYEYRRRKRIQERLEVIELMNHHVRNALQLIALSPHAHQREENLALIQQAVDRIEWALREILPGADLSELQRKDRERVPS